MNIRWREHGKTFVKEYFKGVFLAAEVLTILLLVHWFFE